VRRIVDSEGTANLSPAERTAFVLHDLFGVRFDEVAAIVGRVTRLDLVRAPGKLPRLAR